jgi:NitT/TauT family transport system permease protein
MRHRLLVIACQVATLALFLAVWQWISGRYVEELMISKPSKVFPLFWQWLTDGTLASNAGYTFRNAGIGVALGAVFGIVIGLVLGQAKFLSEVCEPFVTALYTLPKQALIPLFIMWVGIGSQLGVLSSAVIAFFLIFFNTFYGIRDVKRALVDSVQIMGGSRLDVMWRVALPSALIWVVAGFKIAVPQAVVMAVIAEMLAGNEGLGHLVSFYSGQFNSAGTYAALFALLIAGFVVDRLMTWVAKKPLEWKNVANGDN